MKGWFWGMGLAAALVAFPAFGQTSAEVMTAREIASRGLDAYDAGDYQTAADRLQEAYLVVKVPTVALYRARALAKLGRLVEASEIYREASLLTIEKGREEQQREAQRDAELEREALLPRIPRITVLVEGAEQGEVTFEVDDAAVPASLLAAGHALDPGEHTVVGKRGAQEVSAVVTLEERDAETVTLRFTAASAESVAAPASSGTGAAVGAPSDDGADRSGRGWQRPTGFAVGGVGAVGLVVGVVSGIGTTKKRNDLLNAGCDDSGECFDDQDDDVDSYNAALRITNTGLIAGGVLAAAGAVLIVTAPKKRSGSANRELSPWVGIGSAGVRGRF